MEEGGCFGVEDELRCSICLETLSSSVCLVPCMHRFCDRCIRFWLRRRRTCPVCRSEARFTCRDTLLDRVVDSLFSSSPSPRRSPRTLFVSGSSLLCLKFRRGEGSAVVCGGRVSTDLLRGDRLLSLDGVPVSDPSLLLSLVREKGERLTFKVCVEERFGARADPRVKLKAREGVVEVEEGGGSLLRGDFLLSYANHQGVMAMRLLQAHLFLFPFRPCCVLINRDTQNRIQT